MLAISNQLDPADDPLFAKLVTQLVTAAVVTHSSAEVRIFKIDHWFGFKWLKFSGKTLGALGVWQGKLTIPPFVENRIVDQTHYLRQSPGGVFVLSDDTRDIHHRGRSEDNLRRRVPEVAPNTSLFWYSGDTLATGRGSLMGYVPLEDGYWPWFLAFVRNGEWQIVKRNGIHEYEVRMLQESAIAHSGLPQGELAAEPLSSVD